MTLHRTMNNTTIPESALPSLSSSGVFAAWTLGLSVASFAGLILVVSIHIIVLNVGWNVIRGSNTITDANYVHLMQFFYGFSIFVGLGLCLVIGYYCSLELSKFPTWSNVLLILVTTTISFILSLAHLVFMLFFGPFPELRLSAAVPEYQIELIHSWSDYESSNLDLVITRSDVRSFAIRLTTVSARYANSCLSWSKVKLSICSVTASR